MALLGFKPRCGQITLFVAGSIPALAAITSQGKCEGQGLSASRILKSKGLDMTIIFLILIGLGILIFGLVLIVYFTQNEPLIKQPAHPAFYLGHFHIYRPQRSGYDLQTYHSGSFYS